MLFHTRILVCTGVGLMLLGGCSGKTDQAGNATTAAAATPFASSPRKPKPGLWAMTVSADGMPKMMSMRTCIGATAPGSNPFTPPPQPGQTCKRSSIAPTATGYAIDSECSANGLTIAIQGTVSGDFSTSFRTDIVTKMTGPGMPAEAQAGAKSSVEANYVGACPADMKPGDTKQG